MAALLSLPAYAYDGAAYVTPDSWSKHVTANGVKASANGIELENGTLKLGLTTRGYFGLFDSESNANVYQYLRARLADMTLGNGTVYANVYVRGAYNGNANPYDKNGNNNHVFYPFYEGIDQDQWKSSDLSARLYQASIVLDDVVPMTDIALGRIYLDTLNPYKVDGIKFAATPMESLQVGAYYGLPVSFYSNLETHVLGAFAVLPIEATDTKVRAEYSYAMTTTSNDDLNTHVIKARVDQYASLGDIAYGNAYLEAAIVNEAMIFDLAFNANIDATQTGVNAYIMGQTGTNEAGKVNPYVSAFESVLGDESEFVMLGALLSQGLTENFMISAGIESRINGSRSYSNMDYTRFFGTVDIIGLVHYNNFISVIGDYYIAPRTKHAQEESQLLVGLRMTQIVNDSLDLYLGSNVMNYRFHANPIKYITGDPFNTGLLQQSLVTESENNAIAYVGGMWKANEWCVVQLDYTYEYSSIFSDYGKDTNAHTLEAWVNFLF